MVKREGEVGGRPGARESSSPVVSTEPRRLAMRGERERERWAYAKIERKGTSAPASQRIPVSLIGVPLFRDAFLARIRNSRDRVSWRRTYVFATYVGTYARREERRTRGVPCHPPITTTLPSVSSSSVSRRRVGIGGSFILGFHAP